MIKIHIPHLKISKFTPLNHTKTHKFKTHKNLSKKSHNISLINFQLEIYIYIYKIVHTIKLKTIKQETQPFKSKNKNLSFFSLSKNYFA